MKKKLLFMVSSMMILALLAGCGSGNAPSAGGNSPAANGGTNGEAPADDKSPITLTLFDQNTGDPFTNPVAKAITEKPA
ncbi:hypothetical protein HMSSN139_02240 [Paenibacillus sp. HMSSN-139]|nr:hypothetical protein HMSSN139_02240 [Paenibacillus sp. HMSSN-139]